MTLSNLPNEIIFNIADQLDDAGMNALARTNSQMYNLLNIYLYRRDVTKPWSSRSLTWVGLGVEAIGNNTVQWVLDACQYLNILKIGNFHVALQTAADRGYIYLPR
jgi:hypothetical protein